MPPRGLARPPRHCSWHSFWSSPIASGTLARVLDLRARSPPRASRLVSPRRRRRVSAAVTSRLPRSRSSAASAYVFPSRHAARCTCAIDPEGEERRYRYRLPREENAANDLLQMLFPENGNNLQRSMWYRTSRDFPDPDLHSERRMENDNRRHPGQDSRKDYLCDQSLYDHLDFYAAHNRRFKKKYISDASMGGSGYYAGHCSSCECPLHRDYVLHK